MRQDHGPCLFEVFEKRGKDFAEGQAVDLASERPGVGKDEEAETLFRGKTHKTAEPVSAAVVPDESDFVLVETMPAEAHFEIVSSAIEADLM